MAQFNTAENVNHGEGLPGGIRQHEPAIKPTDVMTGDRDQSRFLYYQLKMSMQKAREKGLSRRLLGSGRHISLLLILWDTAGCCLWRIGKKF